MNGENVKESILYVYKRMEEINKLRRENGLNWISECDFIDLFDTELEGDLVFREDHPDLTKVLFPYRYFNEDGLQLYENEMISIELKEKEIDKKEKEEREYRKFLKLQAKFGK